MKNIVNRTLAVKKNIKKSIFVVMACLVASAVFADTKTFTFDDNVALETDWTVATEVPSGGTAKCEISQSIGGSFSAKDGNYLGLAYQNKSGIVINITSKQEFKNITAFSMEVVSGDNGKPTFAAYIVDASGTVLETLFDPIGSKEGFATGGTNKWGSKSVTATGKTGYIKIATVASSSGKYAAIDNIAVTYTAGPSDDASLKSITYTLGATTTPISGIQTNGQYSVELPAGTTTPPTVAAVANDSKATVNVTQITALPGTAIIDVTAEDNTSTEQHKVTFTVESAAPKVQTATWNNIKGTASIDNVNLTITGQVTNGSTLNLTPTFTGKNIQDWNPKTADFSSGPVNITFSSATSETTTYAVTITEAPPVSTDATLKSLKYNGTSVPGFSPTQLTYNVEVEGATAPTVTAEANDANVKSINITQASGVPGVAKVVVLAEDEETTLTYTINFTVGVPSSDLTIHVPEIYEATTLSGGYGGKLRVFGGREYEVYYPGKLESNSAMTVDIEPVQKRQGIAINNTSTSCQAQDGWFKVTANSVSNFTFTEKDEFAAGEGCMHKIYSNNSYLLHIQGFDQFSFYGKDNSTTIEAEGSTKNKRFRVYIDGILQPENKVSTEGTIRRYDISTGEHLIEVKGIGGSNNEFYGFSLRVAQEPRTKWLKGNDSTQTVLATTAPRPIYYFTKYGNISGAETRLEWDGNEATGITLTKQSSGDLGDTLMLSGTANCPAGTYNYKVASYFNGTKTTEVAGKIQVINFIKAITDTVVDAYVGEEMDEIKLRFYNANPDGWQITPDTWPNGITRDAANNIITISGTPTAEGESIFSVCVNDGNCVSCTIRVSTIDYGANPVLYLYKNNLAYEQDGVYDYLKNSDSRNLIARKAKDALRSADQYAKYKWILISEDVDADNPEVLAAARGETGLPVLNMKSFSYSPDRLDWGEPDNGSLTKDNGRFITVLRGDHPIFKGLNKKQGDRIQILDTIILRGLMPAAVDYEGTLCLATAWTRDIEDYHGDGVQETFLHEVPASMNNGKKYICMPIGKASSQHLTADGKRFVKAVVNYLLSDQATVAIPELKITSFKVNGIAGAIDQDLNTIDISIDITKYPSLDLTAVVPEVTVASPLTHVTPLQGEAVDLSKSSFSPVVFEVSDYINRRTYDVTVHTFNPQSIDEVYTVGEWVNIYDIYGRKLTTTNENIYTMSLPRGVYMVVTANGQTIKILR